ncbi:unnamed protein product [Peniophora sp. CBMAI 1063]|nr:unnamed protein product [Peniophora sp. CBMAI 1063]
MASSPVVTDELAHLSALVSQSKHALQEGEALCSRANTLSNASAQDAFDVLALNTKIRWISDAVMEQLKLAACVVKDLENRRSKLEEQAQSWDRARSQQTTALDAILDSLGGQLVPPSFQDPVPDLDLFGSQHSDSEEEDPLQDGTPGHSPTLTIRGGSIRQWKRERKAEARQRDRSRWKSLRDFVDERAIEGALENIENERNELDNTLTVTAAYPHTLQDTLEKIEGGLAPREPPVDIAKILDLQESVGIHMAEQLEGLAVHYEQMERAQGESEAGEAFHEEDLQEMNRDTEELPVILGELGDDFNAIDSSFEELQSARRVSHEYLQRQRETLDDLDELGSIMGDMLQRQTEIEIEFAERLQELHHQLLDIDELTHRYHSYQDSYRKLLVEVARRRHYKDAADQIVRGMMSQLQAMTEEERQVREDFNAEHGQHLPSDICVFIERMPTRWEVRALDTELENLPDIPADLLSAAKDATGFEDGRMPPGAESL